MATTTNPVSETTVGKQSVLASQNWWIWIGLAGLALLPLVGGKTGLISNFGFLQLSLMIVYAIAVLGLNLLTGFNGQISLGHGAFFAVGAYTAAILIDQADWPFWATLPMAALACFIAGYLFGLPALRLEGHYLALATFALAVAVPHLLDSRIGRALRAIRDQPLAADTMGINSSHYKAVTFGISALYTGVAGALHAIIFEFVSPDSFRFELSIAILVGAVVGGIASLPGAVIGGVFVQAIEKYADALTKKISATVYLPLELQPWTIYGIALIILIYTMPTGVAGGISSLRRRFKRS
jgi:branched-chain amino acid transport system permease protein